MIYVLLSLVFSWAFCIVCSMLFYPSIDEALAVLMVINLIFHGFTYLLMVLDKKWGWLIAAITLDIICGTIFWFV